MSSPSAPTPPTLSTDPLIGKEQLHPSVRQAIHFTETYQQHKGSAPAIREAACLRTQFPALLSPIEHGDLFAGGHIRDRITYIGSIWWAMMPSKRGPGKQGGYCFDFAAATRFPRTPADKEAIAALESYWSTECTWSRISQTWDPDMHRFLRDDSQIAGGGSGFVVPLELDRLLQLGIPGILAAIRERLHLAQQAGEKEESDFLIGLNTAMEVLVDCCRHYAAQASTLAADPSTDSTERANLTRMSTCLSALETRPPQSLYEAIQLWWLYSVLACGLHIEGWRIDGALGDFYAADIDSGRLTEDEAIELICGLWKMFLKHSDPAVSRVLVGGRGRRNEPAADRFALGAMEATRRLHQVIPQLTLRFYSGQNPRLLSKAYDVLGEGCTFPMLYNDDINIPGVARALNVSEKLAERYYPLGCGEYLIGGATPSLLSVGWSVPKSLEAALFGGTDSQGREMGPANDTAFGSFDDLWQAFHQQLGHAADYGSRVHAKNLALAPGDCSFLLGSLFLDDCLQRGRGILDGGARHKGGCIMGHGFSNTADALVAIKHLVFNEAASPTPKQGKGGITMTELREALKQNFSGYEDLRRRLLSMPKFGNDHEEVDAMLVRLWQEISALTAAAGTRVGLDFLTVSSVNPGGYYMGVFCGASPDGRLAGEPFAIGNAPTAGADTHGLTALLNSVAKVDPANGGATTNIKLAKNLFSANRVKLEALFTAYWKRGGMQATVTVVNQAELEDAVIHPERYPHLLVRLGGWSARFIDLSKEIQQEILRRTLHA
ncbi:MAG: pyruvate formate lyase family protein [Verrucomicrobiota bacterium]|nr:pyruvate formate lyase family protein [Verrucomicrobiota bacterium]